MKGFNFYFFFALLFVSSLINADLYADFVSIDSQFAG